MTKVKRLRSTTNRNHKSWVYLYWRNFRQTFGPIPTQFHFEWTAVKLENKWDSDEEPLYE